jgi:hypothetical protein
MQSQKSTFQQKNSVFQNHHDIIALPSDLTGRPPPAGSPNFYVRPYDGNLFGDGLPRIEIFEFHADWGVPANTTFGLIQVIDTTTGLASFSSSTCGGNSLIPDCVPRSAVTVCPQSREFLHLAVQRNFATRRAEAEMWPLGGH